MKLKNNLPSNDNLSIEFKNKLLQALINTEQLTTNQNKQPNIEINGDMEEIKLLLKQIKLETSKLNQLFWHKEELEQLQFVADSLELRVQNMIQATLRNLDWYQNEGWKKFLSKEDNLQ